MEQFSGSGQGLTGDDDRLTQVLVKYLAMLGENVEIEDGSDAIPDLVLSRTLETAATTGNIWWSS